MGRGEENSEAHQRMVSVLSYAESVSCMFDAALLLRVTPGLRESHAYLFHVVSLLEQCVRTKRFNIASCGLQWT
jgi:hypothetical protein